MPDYRLLYLQNEGKLKIRKLLSEGHSAETVELMMRRSEFHSPSVRPRDEEGDKLFSDLADLLWDNEAEIRSRAARVLCWTAVFYPQSWIRLQERIAPRLLEMLKDDDPHVRGDVALAIVSMPSMNTGKLYSPEPHLMEKAIPALTNLLKDGNIQVERNAGWALGNVVVDWVLRNRGNHRIALDIQSKLADHKDAIVRSHVADYWVLNAQAFPEAAVKARPLLMKLAMDVDDKVRELAEQSLNYLK